MKTISVIFLIGVVQLLKEDKKEAGLSRCKKEIVETYNLNGYMTPRNLNFYLCPAMKQSCCSLYDQFAMFTTWRDNIRVKLEDYYRGIENKFKRIGDLLKIVFKMNVKTLIEKLHMEQKQKDKVLQSFMLLKDKNLPKLTDQVLQLYHGNKAFMIQLRSTFFCNICDFTSHRYIDVEEKIVYIDEGTCGEIAMNTINFSYFLNVELANYLTDTTKLLMHFSLSASDTPATIKNFSKIRKQVTKCANVFKSGSTNFKACKRYCEHYKLNANAPVIEGYQVFFNEVINSLERFLKNNGPEEIKTGDEDDDDKSRVLNEKDAKSTNKSEPNNDDVETFNFSAGELDDVNDPYDEKAVDPYYDEYVLNKMFSFEKDYVKDRRIGYVNFIKNKLHFVDVEYDYDNASESDLFKMNSRSIIDIENFSTKMRSNGVDIAKHLHTTNIDKSLKDLISHLKSRSKYKILYEKLDPTLLDQVNDISNENVKNFHRDNFLHFTDFSLLLKNEELLNKYDKVKKQSRRKGYYLH